MLDSESYGGEREFILFDLVSALSTMLDLVHPGIVRHHRETGYIAMCLAEELKYPRELTSNVQLAAMVHDIGTIVSQSPLELNEGWHIETERHPEIGYEMLKYFPYSSQFRDIVRYHHIPWDLRTVELSQLRGDIPEESFLVGLSDSVAMMIDHGMDTLSQVSHVVDRIKKLSGSKFKPEHVDAFVRLAKKESFWLDLGSVSLFDILVRKSHLARVQLDTDQLTSYARFLSLIVDARSRFTATHSSGIASVAHIIGHFAGVSRQNCRKLKIAGYLHDIGKVAVSNAILEKNGPLTPEEWNSVRAHPYHTREILIGVRGLGEIVDWASDHHEMLDGSGYPRHLTDTQISMQARIVTLADIFTALTEDRPYRSGMGHDKVMEIVGKMASDGKVSEKLAGILRDNYVMIDCARRTAQLVEIELLSDFWRAANILDPIETGSAIQQEAASVGG